MGRLSSVVRSCNNVVTWGGCCILLCFFLSSVTWMKREGADDVKLGGAADSRTQ